MHCNFCSFTVLSLCDLILYQSHEFGMEWGLSCKHYKASHSAGERGVCMCEWNQVEGKLSGRAREGTMKAGREGKGRKSSSLWLNLDWNERWIFVLVLFFIRCDLHMLYSSVKSDHLCFTFLEDSLFIHSFDGNHACICKMEIIVTLLT